MNITHRFGFLNLTVVLLNGQPLRPLALLLLDIERAITVGSRHFSALQIQTRVDIPSLKRNESYRLA